MRKSHRLLLLCCLGLAACDRGTAPEREPDGLVMGDDASLQRTVAGIQRDLSSLRSLPFDAPVVSRWVKRENLLALLDSIYASHESEPDTSSGPHPSQTEILVALDMMEPTVSAEAEQRKFEGDNIGGFYVNGSGRFWLVEDPRMPAEATFNMIAHELAHAMQDLNFPDTGRPPSSTDDFYATNILVEGEAEYLGDLWSLPGRSVAAFEAGHERITLDYVMDAARLDHPEIPLALTLPVYAHYWVGEWSIHDERKARGWSAIDRLHRLPPRSSERMLHPLAGDDALTFSEWPEEVFSSHQDLVPLGSDRLGEISLAAMLHWRMPALGWNSSSWKGDRFWIWRSGDSLHHLAAGKIRLETAEDAKQFLSKWAGGRGLSADNSKETDSIESLRGDTGLVRAVRKGAEISLLYGSHPVRWPALVADSLWAELVAARPIDVAAARKASATADPSKQSFPRFPREPVRIWKEYPRFHR